MALINIPQVENGDDNDKNLYNSRFGKIVDEINGKLDSSNLANDAVSTPKLANSSVSTNKIEDEAVTGSKLAPDAGGGEWQEWSPTFTGFSSNPANGLYRYKVVGKTVFVSIRMPSNGTSNSTAFTISAPIKAKLITNGRWELPCRIINNGATAFGFAAINSNATTIGFGLSATSETWTTSGGKRVISAEFFYEID